MKIKRVIKAHSRVLGYGVRFQQMLAVITTITNHSANTENFSLKVCISHS